MRPRDADEVCASVSSEVMEEGGSHRGGRRGRPGRRGPEVKGEKRRKCKKKKRFKAS